MLQSVQSSLRDRGSGCYRPAPSLYTSQDYLGFVVKPFCQSLDLDCVNRFGDLRAASRDQYTFPIDGHYNSGGALNVAKALALDLLE